MKTKALFLILLVLLACSALNSQPYYFRHYQVEHGISNNTVGCCLQDRQGFLWFGTKDGLNRFDGYSFKTFRKDRHDPRSIGNNFITCLHEDQQGVLWVGTQKGLFHYEAGTESFSPITGATEESILDIQTDKNGGLWFISRMRLYRYDRRTGGVRPYRRPGWPDITSVCTTADGALWISTAAGTIGQYDKATDSFRLHQVFAPSIPLGARWIEKLYGARNGLLFIGTSQHGIKIFDTHSAAWTDVPMYNADKTEVFVRDVIQHSEDEYWIATESGIFIYHRQSGKLVHLQKSYGNPYSLSDNAVYSFCRDKEGGIWAGTYFGGVNYYPGQFTRFQKYFPQYGVNAISGNAVREICPDRQGNLWIGTEDAGLNRLDTATGQFTHFRPGKAPSMLAHSNIHGLLVHGDELWVGTFHHGLDVQQVSTGKRLRHYSAALHGLKSDFVYCLYKTRGGRLLAATDRGLCAYDPRSDRFSAVTEIPSTFYTSLYEDRFGTLWAGTYSEGLYCFNPRTGEKGHYRYAATDSNSLGGDRVNWLFEDSGGGLWIATEGGLCRFNREQKNFTGYTTQNGLPSNIIFAVLEDAKKNFWISTSRGLACFSPATGKVKVYTTANGLLSDQFNYKAAYKDASGRMYFGSVKGLVSFHPEEFLRNTYLPPVIITGFQVYEKELAINQQGSPLKRSIAFTPAITLQHNQSSFSIDFAAFSYTAPEMTEYAYKMGGLDKHWTYLKTNRKAYFTELAPGTYTFQVKASVSNGTWSQRPTVLRITILPPFWASLPALLLYALILAGLVWLALRNYHRRNEEKSKRRLEKIRHEKEKELYQAKIDFFTHVAHEIRTPMTLIVGPMQKILQKADEVPFLKNNLQIMKRNTDRLMDLATQLLDFRKTEIQGFRLNFAPTDVAELLRDLYTRFRPAAEEKNLLFELQVPPSFTASVDAEALNKIVSNLFSNAIKYARTRVSAELLPGAAGDNRFCLRVKNDGFLVPYEMREKIFETFFRLKETQLESGTGIGLALSRSLAQLHHGSLELAAPDNDLNVFVLSLPVRQQGAPDLNHPQKETSL